MTERQFQTLRWAVILACLASFIFLFVGCGVAQDRDPFIRTARHPKEALAVEYCRCFADATGAWLAEVNFTDEKYVLPDGTGRWAAAWTLLDGKIVFYRPWLLDAADIDIKWVAGHEICHMLKGTGDENIANACNVELQGRGICE